jgi:hypothetical protein
VDINGGTIDATTIGATTAAAATVTNLTATGTVDLGTDAIQTGEIENGAVTTGKLANNSVTYGKMQAVSTTSRLLGSSSTTTPVQEISLGSGLNLTGTTLTATGLGGTVTDFSSGDLSPLFTTSVATSTTTPALSFSLSNAGAYSLFGNNTGVNAAPTFFTPILASALFQNQGTVNGVLHGNAAGNPSWSQIVNADINASAAIALSKLATGTDAQIIVGSTTGVPTYVDATGDVTISNAGVMAIGLLKVTNGMLADDAVTSGKLADDAVISGKIADDAVTTGKLKDLAVTKGKLADGAVTTAKLADDAVTTVKILDANVTPVKIAPGANDQVLVTDGTGAVAWIDKDAFGAVADQVTIVGDGTTLSPFVVNDLGITTAKLAADAVTNAELADNSVRTENIVDGQVQTADIANLNVTTGKLAFDAVTNAQLFDNAVQTENILNETIRSEDIYNGTIVTADIADDAITTDKILNANVTTAKIADADVTPIKIEPGANDQVLVTDETGTVAWIDNDTFMAIADQVTIEGLGTTLSPFVVKDLGITTAKLADDAVTTIKIADLNVTTAKINADAVTSAKILNETILSEDIFNGTIVTADIANDAITTAKILDANVIYAKIQNVSATDKVLGRVSAGAGVVEEISTTGSGDVVRANSPTLVTPDLGEATATTINGNTITTGTGTLTIAAGKTLTVSNTLTLAGIDGTTMIFPSTSANIARTDAAQTFTGVQTFSSLPTFSALTQGSIPFAGASGAISQDNANLFWDNTNKRLGIGTAPTAILQLKAGTTTAGTAPLKFTTGTDLTTPEDGAVEYDGDNLTITDQTATRYTLAKTLTNTASLDFPNTGGWGNSSLTMTLTGAALGDVVVLGVPNSSTNANSYFFAWVSSANTVTVRYLNNIASNNNPAAGTFRVSVIKY